METTRQEEYPHLFSFAKNKTISLSSAWDGNNESLYNLFHLPLSTITHEEFHSLQEDMQNHQLSTQEDIWILS
jgi:hypothetical protein